MANKLLHKKSAVENKTPLYTDLEYGELAVNTFDGNIYLRKSDDTITEMKRLDARLDQTNVTSMLYNGDGDLDQVVYETGNVITLQYSDGNLASVYYYAVDGETHLFTQTLTYDSNDNVISTDWSAE